MQLRHLLVGALFACAAAKVSGHPGNGIVVLSDGSILTGDALHSKVWRFKKDGTREQVLGDFHCHWVTRGLDGMIYGERITERSGWDLLIHRIDLERGTAVKTLTLGPKDSSAFVVDAQSNVIAFAGGGLVQISPNGTREAFCKTNPTLKGAKAMAWGKNGQLLIVEGNRLWTAKAGQTPVLKKTFTGRATHGLYAGANGTRQLWGVAADQAGRPLVADASIGQILRLESDGKVTILAKSEENWVATGLAVRADDVILLESKTVGSTNEGPRVSVVEKSGRVRVIGTADGPRNSSTKQRQGLVLERANRGLPQVRFRGETSWCS